MRIISPQYSRAKDGPGISTVTSPPPPGLVRSASVESEYSSSEEPSPVDPFNVQSEEGTPQNDDDDLRRNTIANATPPVSQTPPSLKTPINPNRKAPALQFGGDASTLGQSEQPKGAAPAPSASRPHYDVDDFKRLLLTGEKLHTDKTTPTYTPPANVQGLQLGDSNSNTDASSVSRQSIFEPHPEAHPESPGTSMDLTLSDDERHGLVQPSPNVGRNRPSVPPSRHGKLVKQNIPQTVSFESLSSSPPGPNLPLTFSAKPSSPTSPINIKNIDKPLPPPPRVESPTPIEATSDYPLGAVGKEVTSSNIPHHLGQKPVKRSPPALPAARRHGQGRSRSSTNDSSRSTSISEEFSQHTHPSPTNSSSTTSSKPPPLPPPRRAATNPTQESMSPIASVFPATDATEPAIFKPRPPAPPSRTPSSASVKRMSRMSATSGSSVAVPLPPPRRRGSSRSQSSFMPSRLSGEYRFEGGERARSGSGASSIQQSSAPETQSQGKDIMADLTALQREVDELRGKFGR